MPAKYIPRITLTCDHCGKSFERQRAEMRGQRRVYCSKDCRTTGMVRAQHPRYKAARTLGAYGYIRVTTPDGRTMPEHRWVMEQQLGRPLRSDEEIHHKDLDRTNNDPSNLQVMSHVEHMKLHRLNGVWSRKYSCCIDCGTKERTHIAHGRCNRCHIRMLVAQRKAA